MDKSLYMLEYSEVIYPMRHFTIITRITIYIHNSSFLSFRWYETYGNDCNKCFILEWILLWCCLGSKRFRVTFLHSDWYSSWVFSSPIKSQFINCMCLDFINSKNKLLYTNDQPAAASWEYSSATLKTNATVLYYHHNCFLEITDQSNLSGWLSM